MKNVSELNKILLEKRKELGLTQMEVAGELGYLSPQFISNWERGLANPPIPALKQLVKIYKLNQDEVFALLVDSHRRAIHAEFYGTRRRK